MGCSASRPTTIVSKHEDDPSPLSYFSASCSAGTSPQVARALSLPTPLVHHPPIKKGDTHHLVCLTSTTYGSLLLIDQTDLKSAKLNGQECPAEAQSPTFVTHQAEAERSMSLDSVINTWELMDGLDDFSDDFDEFSNPRATAISNRVKDFSEKPSSCRYTTFDGSPKKKLDSFESLKLSDNADNDFPLISWSRKPLWQHLSEESLLSKMDPNVALSYRRALSARHLGINSHKTARSVGSSPLCSSSFSTSSKWSSGSSGIEDRVVLYFTSLRGIRKTYEDCASVRMILKGFRVAVDERDISMDSSYRKELQGSLGGKPLSLPQVFIRGKHMGGADEIKQLNETGELAKVLKGMPTHDPGFVCETCGDARFVPCLNCNGSRKIFQEEEGELKRCPGCNENGLIRCPCCCP